MKNKVLLFAALLSLSCNFEPCASAADTPQLNIKTDEFVAKLESQISPLLKQYFPRAATKKSPTSYHVDFKAATFATIDGGMLLTPKTDGIVFDVSVKPGKYRGNPTMPLTTNETLYYSIQWVLYSPAENSHVVVKLFCPHDINISISDDLRDAVQEFVTGLETSAVPKATFETQAHSASDVAASVGVKPTASSEVKATAPAEAKTNAAAPLASDGKATIADIKISNSTPSGGAAATSVTTKVESSNSAGSASSDGSANAGSANAFAAGGSANSEKADQAPELELGFLKDAISSVSIPKFSEGTTPTANGNAFAPTPKTAAVPPPKSSVAGPLKAPPKPSPAYFKSWFSRYYEVCASARYMQDVMPFFSATFNRTKLRGAERLPAVASNAVYKQFRKVTFIDRWSFEKAQPGPYGCWDVIVNGRTYSGHPAYLIYRMVPEAGTWRIDNAQGRFWTSGSREL